jgi:hypothetical protein
MEIQKLAQILEYESHGNHGAYQHYGAISNNRNYRQVLSNDEKLEYIRAVKCLYANPAQGQAYFPAVKTRHDDFASLHINQTSPPDPTRNPASEKPINSSL